MGFVLGFLGKLCFLDLLSVFIVVNKMIGEVLFIDGCQFLIEEGEGLFVLDGINYEDGFNKFVLCI